MRCSRAASCIVPTTASTGDPFRNIMKVGIDWTSYLVAIADCSSTLSFPKLTVPANFEASLSTTGSMVLQGPHQTGQKSTKVTFPLSTTCSKLASVNSNT